MPIREMRTSYQLDIRLRRLVTVEGSDVLVDGRVVFYCGTSERARATARDLRAGAAVPRGWAPITEKWL